MKSDSTGTAQTFFFLLILENTGVYKTARCDAVDKSSMYKREDKLHEANLTVLVLSTS